MARGAAREQAGGMRVFHSTRKRAVTPTPMPLAARVLFVVLLVAAGWLGYGIVYLLQGL